MTLKKKTLSPSFIFPLSVPLVKILPVHFYPTHFDTKRTPLNQNIFTLGSRHFGTQTLRANARLRRFMQVLCHKIFTPDPNFKPYNVQIKPHFYPTHFDTKRTPLNPSIFTLGSRHTQTQTLRANARLRRFMQVLCHKIFTPDPNFKPYNVQIK